MASKLAEEIYLLMNDTYYPRSGTFGDFWRKSVLLEFIQNSGLPLGYRTLKDACNLEDERLKGALDKLTREGYIREVNTPANFLFQGDDGLGYELILDAEAAANEAQERIAKDEAEEAARKLQAANTAAPEVSQPAQAAIDPGTGGDKGTV